jgi:c-di-GMP-binding flagellar brake protein YcgR
MIQVGQPIRLVLTREDEAFEGIAPVLDYRVTQDVASLFVARPEWLVRFRRRRSMRDQMCACISVIPTGTCATVCAETRAELSDLSSGGCSIALPERVAPGTALRICLPFPDLRTDRIIARVLACDRMFPGGDFTFRARCKFIELSDATQNRLVEALGALTKASP